MTRQCKECKAKTIEDLRKAIISVVSDLQASNENFKKNNEYTLRQFFDPVIIAYQNKICSLEQKLETLQDEIGHLQQVLLQIKDLAMCGGDCEQDCDHCMQGQIDKLIREALNGRED